MATAGGRANGDGGQGRVVVDLLGEMVEEVHTMGMSLWMPACMPACLPACLSACMPACLPACMPACLRLAMEMSLTCMLACTHAGEMDEEAQIRLAMEMSLAESADDARAAEAGLVTEASAAGRSHALSSHALSVDLSAEVTGGATSSPVDLTAPTPELAPLAAGSARVDMDITDDDDGRFGGALQTGAGEEEGALPADLARGGSGSSQALSRYQLCATVWHAGANAGSGHYIADVRHAAGGSNSGGGASVARWQRFDDSDVRPIREDAPDATTKGYIFFYVHSGALS